jgi:hypothetical protein
MLATWRAYSPLIIFRVRIMLFVHPNSPIFVHLSLHDKIYIIKFCHVVIDGHK